MFQIWFGNEKLRVNGMGSCRKAERSCRERNLVYIYDIVLMVFLGGKSTGTVNEITQPSAFQKRKKIRKRALKPVCTLPLHYSFIIAFFDNK